MYTVQMIKFKQCNFLELKNQLLKIFVTCNLTIFFLDFFQSKNKTQTPTKIIGGSEEDEEDGFSIEENVGGNYFFSKIFWHFSEIFWHFSEFF